LALVLSRFWAVGYALAFVLSHFGTRLVIGWRASECEPWPGRG
jgi:hypothetical protein